MIKKIQITVTAAFCDDCKRDLHSYDGWGYVDDEKNHKQYCYDCGLKNGTASALEWLNAHGIGIYRKASYENGVITAYQKWGKGYRQDKVVVFEDVGV